MGKFNKVGSQINRIRAAKKKSAEASAVVVPVADAELAPSAKRDPKRRRKMTSIMGTSQRLGG